MINLAVPHGGYIFTSGDSMDPTITQGCNIIESNEWDGESSLQGEIVVYQPTYQDPYKFEFQNGFEVEYLPLIAHTVVAEYKEYDMDESSYYINEEGRLVMEDDRYNYDVKRITNQPYESAKKLEGEHVLILEGDNNPHIDLEIVPVDNVKSIINEDNYYNLQDIDSFPCSIFNSY